MTYVLLVAGLLVWAGAHWVGIAWGTNDVPMHQTYVADEQRPVNGALHILKERSLLGLRSAEESWYGPTFSLLVMPAIVADFVRQYVFEGVRSANDYMNSIVFDWGGIVFGMHVTAVVGGVVALLVVYKMFLLRTLNPTRQIKFAAVATSLVACNYFFFENSTIFMNWIFVVFFLFAQLYIGLLIYESEGKESKYWYIHAGLTVLSFGINYLNIIYSIAFVPLVILLWWTNDRGVRRNLYIYIFCVLCGLALMIWWNPFTFVRLLGSLGLGSMAVDMSTEYGSTYNPFASVTTSYLYYMKVLFVNHLPIFLILISLAYSVLVCRFKNNLIWIWMFGSIALVNFLVFGSLGHYEERYILVTTTTILLLVGSMVLHYLALPDRNRILTVVVATSLVSYLGFHVVHIGKWIEVYADGPAEKKMISEVLAKQESGATVVLVQGHLAGHVHTKESYRRFLEKKGLQDVNLYKVIMNAPLPADTPPLNVDYILPGEYMLNAEVVDSYTQAIMYTQGCSLEINQATYIGENILSLWFWDECKSRYLSLK